MGWKQEMQLRHRYTADGNSEMSWQPTSVYVPDESRNSSEVNRQDREETAGIILTLVSAGITTLIYHYVSHIGFIERLSFWPHRILLITVAFSSFVALVLLLDTRVGKVGFLVLCAGYFFWAWCS